MITTKHYLIPNLQMYKAMVNELNKAVDLAMVVLLSKKFSRKSNCKVMATRITQFQVEKISVKVEHLTKKMHDFFMTTYSGVGGTLCKAENQAFMNVAENTFTLSESFCRDLTSNTLPVLLYKHIHYIRFYRLVAQFITQCDHLGNHNVDATVPAEVALKEDETIMKELSACKEFRNDSTWINSCGGICEDFNFVNISDVFYGNLDGFVAATKYLTDQLKFRFDEMNEAKKKAEPEKKEGEEAKKEGEEGAKEGAKEGDKTETKETSKQERILERIKFRRDVRVLEGEQTSTETPSETKKEGEGSQEGKKEEGKEAAKEAAKDEVKSLVPVIKLPTTPEEQLANAKDPAIFSNVKDKAAKLGEPKVKFQGKGMDPYSEGKMVKYDDTEYNKILQVIEAAEAEAAKKAGKAGEDGVVEKKTSGLFIGVGRLVVDSLLVMFATFLFGF